jgi:hypothetical protein
MLEMPSLQLSRLSLSDITTERACGSLCDAIVSMCVSGGRARIGRIAYRLSHLSVRGERSTSRLVIECGLVRSRCVLIEKCQ